jgi:hypothetical protein
MGRGIKEANWKHWCRLSSRSIARNKKTGEHGVPAIFPSNEMERAGICERVRYKNARTERGENKWYYIIGDGRMGLRDTPPFPFRLVICGLHCPCGYQLVSGECPSRLWCGIETGQCR